MPITSPSIRSVAAKAGVSIATVSNVLTGKSSVNAALVARVRAAVEELGYVADHRASRLRSGKHPLIGMIVPNLNDPMFSAFVSIFEHLARMDGFDLLVVSSANEPAQEAERLSAIRSWRPAGLIVIPCDGALTLRLPKGSNSPIVVVDRIPDDDAFDLVAVNNGEAAATVTAHLAGQGRSCLVAGDSLSISNVRERWDGVRSAAGAMKTTMVESGSQPDALRNHLLRCIAQDAVPDSFFALDHRSMLIGYPLLAEFELNIPGQIAFASFDEADWMGLVAPGVTAVRQPVEAMAENAWAQLMLRLAGDTSPPHLLRLPCAVNFRGSTIRGHGAQANKAA